MTSMSQMAEAGGMVLSLIAYGSLFAVTIRQNRKNRAVVLGVVTVGMFGGFLYYVHLAQKQTPPRLLATMEALLILTGVGVVVFVALDVFRWVSGKREPAAGRKDRTAESGPGTK